MSGYNVLKGFPFPSRVRYGKELCPCHEHFSSILMDTVHSGGFVSYQFRFSCGRTRYWGSGTKT